MYFVLTCFLVLSFRPTLFIYVAEIKINIGFIHAEKNLLKELISNLLFRLTIENHL